MGWKLIKNSKDLSTQPRFPLLAPEALWRARAQIIPLGLIVVRTSQEPQPGLVVQSCGWYKTLLALTVEAEHCNETLLMRCCVSVERSENSFKISNTALDTKRHFVSQ